MNTTGTELGQDTPGRYLAIGWNTCRIIIVIAGAAEPHD